MKYDTSELCDIYQEDVNVVEPLFSNFGGRSSFGGQIVTVKCFEDNGLLYDLLEQNGRGRVLVVDGGGSVRRALIDAELAGIAVQNEWEGLVVYGSVRQVDDLEDLDIGIQAIAAIPVGAAGDGIGESDVRVNFGGVTFFSGEQHAGGRELSATRIGKIGHGQIERGDTQASTLFIGQQERRIAKMHIFQRDLHPR